MAVNRVDIREGRDFYYQSMRKTIVQFLDLFDEITIGRYDNSNGQLLKYVAVPLKFAPKSKQWYWSEKTDPETGNRIRDKILPMIACNLTDVEYASGRSVNKKFRMRTNERKPLEIERFFNPVPYDFNFEVKVAAEYMVDIIQIMERILPFFDSCVYIRLVIPELDIVPEDVEYGAHPLDLKVLYTGSSPEIQTEYTEEEYRILMWTMSFTVEGYLFKPKYTYPLIKQIYREYRTSTDRDHFLRTITTGLSASYYPLDVTTEELSGSILDKDIGLLYKYEEE